MSDERFTWKTEKLQHLDDEVLMVVDNENKEWEGHILNIVDKLNELAEENEQLRHEKMFANSFIIEKKLEKEYVKYVTQIKKEIYDGREKIL